MTHDTEPTMRHSQSWRPRPPVRPAAWVVLAALVGPVPAGFAQQAADPALAQLQQQLQPISGAQLQAPAEQQVQQVQQVQAAPQPLPVVRPLSPAQAQAQAAAPAAEAPPQAAVAPPRPVAVAQPPLAMPRPSVVGPATTAWLDLQRSNRAASPEAHPFEGAAASSAYQRYLQSFAKPIPTWFTSVQRSSGGGSSGGGDLQSQ
ncbi:DUF3613 domain-containing protein [Burkholderia plantarii]|uniref:DUF3613 domain-containing protein n=1 Tax=Burkholderia plantarii TaxID=41899 RepID=UPI0008707276|nr:DUF3613 domain-containing protein [Burkholderia plantarii]